ncbi:hypothetical protein FRB99_002408 [Tulasnella sp. 403]|nr:hypothetical protein FRB99_002408 [Tulasnella sp. 403]
MQQLYRKARKLSLSSKPNSQWSSDPLPVLTNQPPFPSVLPPKFSVPAVLHPHPYRQISVFPTNSGLILRPVFENASVPSDTHVRLSWGKDVVIHESGDLTNDVDQSVTVIAHGILGILDIFDCPYLFLITAKEDLGNLFKGHSVCRIHGVSAIPLVNETVAIAALKRIDAKIKPAVSSGKPRSLTLGDAVSPSVEITTTLPSPLPEASSSAGHVKFGPEPLRIATNPAASASATSLPTKSLMVPPDPVLDGFASGQTTPTSSPASRSNSPVSATILERLSFWKKKKQSDAQSTHTVDSSISSNSILDDDDSDDASTDTPPQERVLNGLLSQATPPDTTEEKHTQVQEKVVREIIREFSRGLFFYSHEFDITRSLQHKYESLTSHERNKSILNDLGAQSPSSPIADPLSVSPLTEPHANLPLWRRVDKKFWWNENMSRPFTDAGLHNYVLPVMQGYFQLSEFHLPSSDYTLYGEQGNLPITSNPELDSIQYAIISRRSTDRAGLRYQRRGIDDEAHVANFVETESIVQVKRDGNWNTFSHVQIRGSIPLFWSQTGLNLKPPPVLDRPREESMDVLGQHFDRITHAYGPITAVNVAELTGKEAHVTTPYREALQELKAPQVSYHEFDFHRECAGMHYENISKLVSRLERSFAAQGFFWVSGSSVLSTQHGVFRVNCIDCLDRTNVVMSAFAKQVLNAELGAVAIVNHREVRNVEMENVFNDAWANNGDAISRAYAGTSALKGDFTRTGRRDLGGMLNDGMNSVMRMYSSTFSDYFSQACIDFLLGNRNSSVFSEFLSKLSSTDPKEMIRLSKIRAAAIETSVELVLYKGETLLNGWTMLSPLEINTKVGNKFVEKVILLSAQAIYVVNFDYTMDKVKMYTRIPLGDITGIQKGGDLVIIGSPLGFSDYPTLGAYILSALQEASRTVVDNYGFVISFRPRQTATRITSYALRNETSSYPGLDSIFSGDSSSAAETSSRMSKGSIVSNILDATTMGPNEQLFVAFKAIPVEIERERRTSDGHEEFVAAHPGQTCKQTVDSAVETVRKACVALGNGVDGVFVTEKDVVSLAEAQRLASFYSKFEYAFKRLLWLGVS